MATFEMNKGNIESSIENNDILLIDFWAEWCGPCKSFGPVFEKASEKYPDIAFAKCNTEKEPEVAGLFGVQSIPTLAIFREKALIFIQPGALPPAGLEEIINKVKDLDMDDVRAQMAKAEAEAKQEHDKQEEGAAPESDTEKKKPDEPVADEKQTLVTDTSEAGEGLTDMADDFVLRRQGVTREFLALVQRGTLNGPPKDVVIMYDKLRRAMREGGSEGRDKAAQLFAAWDFKPDQAFADLSAELRSEAKAVLRAIEELLKQ